MTYDDVKIYLDIAQCVWMTVASIWAIWFSRNTTLEKIVANHTQWLTRHNEQLKHLPGDEEFGVLAGDVKAIRSDIDGMRETLTPIQRQLEMINQHLLNQGGRQS